MTPPERPPPDPPPGRGLATRAVHAGTEPAGPGPMTPPIVQSSTFRLEHCRAGAEATRATAPEAFYTRWGNPTLKRAESALAELEGAEAALCFASGMGAISAALLSFLSAGDHVVVGRSIYSGVHELAARVLPRWGIEATFADARDPAALEAALRPATRLVVVESPTNPLLELCDLEALGRLGRAHGVLTLVDGTFATPVNQRPLELGVDLVAHAATKALGGHSDLTAGALCARRELVDACWPTLKLLGACLSPFEAWLLLRGLKTLPLRVERQSATALRIARFLEARPGVRHVRYPGLPSHPQHALARRQMRAFGGIVSFEIEGSREDAAAFAERLELVQLAVSLGGCETLVEHPATMTHGTLTDDELRAAGIAPGLLRLSAGLEDPEDLERDLGRALERAGDRPHHSKGRGSGGAG